MAERIEDFVLLISLITRQHQMPSLLSLFILKYIVYFRRRISMGKIRPWNTDLVVDWAEQQDEPDDEVMSQVKVLYVRNLKEAVSEQRLTEMFEKYGEVDKVKRIKDYAFIHFKERDPAVQVKTS
jgi:hypothetical protein